MKQLIYKTIYAPAVNRLLRAINKTLSPILPNKIKIPPAGILTFTNDQGKQIKIKTNQTSFMTHLLFWEGYQNFEYTDIFIKLIRKTKIFYDIGTNLGYYSLLAEMENPDIKVVAFEPAKGPLFFAKENVEINNFKNITIEDIHYQKKMWKSSFLKFKTKSTHI